MQLLSFNAGEDTSFGAMVEGRVVDLGRHLPEYDSLRDLFVANALVRALDTAAEESPDYRLDKIQLRTPITDAAQLLCVFDAARDEPVSVDPKFLRGSLRPLRIPEGDVKPVAVGVAVAVRTVETGYEPLGYMPVCYLSPATLAAGPWLTTPDELGDDLEFTLQIETEEQKAELVLPDPTEIALNLAADRSLETGDLVALLHYLPEIAASTDMTVKVTVAELGTLTCPVEAQPD